MNMRTGPWTHLEITDLKDQLWSKELPINTALNLLDSIIAWPTNTELVQKVARIRTELLQMRENWIEYVSGAIKIMLDSLVGKNTLPMWELTQIFTTPIGVASNNEVYKLAA